jgi:hypothetical protein
MFRDKRDFRAIAFTVPSLKSIAGMRDLLPQNSISEGEQLTEGSPQLQIEHMYYYSRERFSPSPELDNVKKVWQGIEQYRYDLYLLGFTGPNFFVGMVAVPLLRMGLNLFRQIHEGARGSGLLYQKVSLERLLKAVTEGRHMGGSIRITNIQMLIFGDPSANSILIGGENALNSKTFKCLSNSLTGLQFDPLSCRVIYDRPEGQRFYMGIDRFGNYSFYVRAGGYNLHWASNLLSYLYKEKVIDETPAIPLRRLLEELEREENA